MIKIKKYEGKKRNNRIWLSNKYKKPNNSLRDKTGKLIPIKENCVQCGKKVRFHHVFCNKCHRKQKKKKERKIKNKAEYLR